MHSTSFTRSRYPERVCYQSAMPLEGEDRTEHRGLFCSLPLGTLQGEAQTASSALPRRPVSMQIPEPQSHELVCTAVTSGSVKCFERVLSNFSNAASICFISASIAIPSAFTCICGHCCLTIPRRYNWCISKGFSYFLVCFIIVF